MEPVNPLDGVPILRGNSRELVGDVDLFDDEYLAVRSYLADDPAGEAPS